MKLFLLATLLVSLMILPASAQTVVWSTANQITVAWDEAVTADIPQEQITYDVLLANSVTDPTKANPVVVQEDITVFQHTITLNTEGKFFVGVRTVRSVDSEKIKSTIAWSDDPVATNDSPFGVQYFKAPNPPGGLGLQQ